ncbi:MAG: HAMP domain-containing sensor histidine kinase [Pseudomonadota bacterium]
MIAWVAGGLLGLAVLAGGSGTGLLLAEASGLLTGTAPEAGWLIACGLISAGLCVVARGLSQAAQRLVPAADVASEPRPCFISMHTRAGETLALPLSPLPASGLTEDGLLGARLFERIQVADRPAFLSAVAATIMQERPHLVELRLRCGSLDTAPRFERMQARIVHATPQTAHVEWTEAATHSGETDARTRAEAASDAKSQFLRTISHELRTPLNSILGFSELLTGEGGELDPARRADYARIIHESGQHLLGLVNGILDLSRVEAGTYDLACEDLDIHAVVSSAVEMMALDAERRGVRLVNALPEHLPPVTADPRALRQILLNLLSNAVKFTSAEGRVEVDTFVVGGMLHLKVRDTGAGMRAADLERLGEPFFQAGDMEQRRAGVGLGLAVVRALVELHRGAFDVASVLGVGTTVTVSLPLCGPAGVAATPFRPALPLQDTDTGDRRWA